MPSSPQQCADETLDVIPLVMRSIRAEMRGHRSPGLSVPQFRALAFTGMNTGATLGELADHLGLMPPAASAVVEGLVALKLIERSANTADRRRICLALTATGREKLATTRRIARNCLAEMFSPLSGTECGQVLSAMKKLRELFLNVPGKRPARTGKQE
jgi:DNA-binding MarR family transcriptional regulator